MKLLKSYRWACLSLALGLLSAGSAFAREGGVSGGGGGIAPVDRAGPALIEQALRESRLALTLYFQTRELQERDKPTPTGRLLFEGPTSIFDLVRSSPIETKGTCRDPQGKRRDGAAPGKRPLSVCMDVKSLGRKLTEDNYWAQTIALLGHELSHLLGTSEREAAELQRDILGELRSERSYVALARKSNVAVAIDVLSNAVEMAQLTEFNADPEMLVHTWQNALSKAEKLHQEIFNRRLPLRVLGENEFWRGRAIYRKVQLLTAAAFARQNNSVNAPHYQGLLERAFRGQTSATLREVESRIAHEQLPPFIPERKLERAVDEASYRREAASTLALINELRAQVGNLPPASVPLIEKDYTAGGSNAISWATQRVSLSASDFVLTVNGEKFTGQGKFTRLTSDPGERDYWTFEATWLENGREMSFYIYFEGNENEWWIRDMRTSNGKTPGEWIYYYGNYLRTPRGQGFQGDIAFSGFNEEGDIGILEFKDLSLRPTAE